APGSWSLPGTPRRPACRPWRPPGSLMRSFGQSPVHLGERPLQGGPHVLRPASQPVDQRSHLGMLPVQLLVPAILLGQPLRLDLLGGGLSLLDDTGTLGARLAHDLVGLGLRLGLIAPGSLLGRLE